jgi:hypothetical protein
MIAVIALSFASQLVLADPNFVPIWFAAWSPISYVVGLIVTAPVSVTVASLAWFLRRSSGRSGRSVAVASTLVVWVPVIGIVAMARAYDSRTVAESALTIVASVVLFALFMPIPKDVMVASGD